MSEVVPAHGLVVSHGLLAEGMVDAVRRVTGIGEEALVGISNHGISPDALLNEIRRRTGDGPVIIFTDMPSGSCSLAARRLQHEDPSVAVIGGVNLPMLLDFVLNRDLPLPELALRLVEKGRASIMDSPSDPKRNARSPLSSR